MNDDDRDVATAYRLRLSDLAAGKQTEFALGLALAEVVERAAAEDYSAAFGEELSSSDPLDGLDLNLRQSSGATVEDLLIALRELGFGRPLKRQPAFVHSHLKYVISRREGIPITLALVFIELARRWGLTAVGLNHPGHFLAYIDQQIVDPVTLNVLRAEDLKPAPAELDQLAASPRMIGLRMLNNLKAMLMARADIAQCLDMVDLQLAISGEDTVLASSLHFERGEFWQRLGAPAAARDAYLRCAELSQDGELAGRARLLAAGLLNAQDTETLH
jgi:hypothetical protein